MKITVDVDGDWGAIAAAEVKSAEMAVTRGVAATAQSLKQLWRNQVSAAGLGAKLSNSIRALTYPRAGYSLGAAAVVYSKAPKLIRAHDEGPTITSKDGFWLAIALPAAGKGLRGAKITPAEWERRTGRRLAFIYRRGRSALLIDNGNVTSRSYLDKKGFHKTRRSGRKNVWTPIFALVPRVKLKKSLDIAGAANQAASGITSAIVANWRG